MTGLQTNQAFQLSTIGVGVLATGIASIRQRIALILNTIPGSDPLRPLFGADVWQYVDQPTDIAIPNIKKAIFEALNAWESTIRVNAIRHSHINEILNFEIIYGIIDSDIVDSLNISFNSEIITEGSSAGLILTAAIPLHVENGFYTVLFNLNNEPAYPTPPAIGWNDLSEMLDWLNSNWGSYGVWSLGNQKLICYMSPNISVNASNLAVGQYSLFTLKTLIPLLFPGEWFNLILNLDGNPLDPEFPINSINTIEGLLNFLTNNFGNLGEWSYLNNGVIMKQGDFNTDFNDDFDNSIDLLQRYIVFQSKQELDLEIIFI